MPQSFRTIHCMEPRSGAVDEPSRCKPGSKIFRTAGAAPFRSAPKTFHTCTRGSAITTYHHEWSFKLEDRRYILCWLNVYGLDVTPIYFALCAGSDSQVVRLPNRMTTALEAERRVRLNCRPGLTLWYPCHRHLAQPVSSRRREATSRVALLLDSCLGEF